MNVISKVGAAQPGVFIDDAMVIVISIGSCHVMVLVPLNGWD